MKGYKMTKLDGSDFYSGRYKYEVGKETVNDHCDPAETGAVGHGLHISKEPWHPLKYNVQYPWLLFEVEFSETDIIAQDADKWRVRRCMTVREMEPFDIGLPNTDKFRDIVERATKITLWPQTDNSKRLIRGLVQEHVIALNGFDPARQVKFKTVKFYTIKEWAAVWAAVRAAVRDSVWVTVWATVWAAVCQKHQDILAPEFAILGAGAVLIGVTDDGIAHVVMPGKDEII